MSPTTLNPSVSPAPQHRPTQYQFKLVLLGESAVGKSSLVLRFVKDKFDEYKESTIGAAFLTKTLTLESEDKVKFEIWDTAGQERYKSLAPMYYRNANCAIVVYDITQAASFQRAQTWIEELKKQAESDILILLAGNKMDLEDRRTVSSVEGSTFAAKNGLLFSETSAKDATNTFTMFQNLAIKLAETRKSTPEVFTHPQSRLNLSSDSNQLQNSCSC
ncbi:hypothetical protein BB561_000684 [Smittium simulii]|uniref:GTP-binding protein ypt5 n=1 Tax=Smittium simulii TaxID=133385 RepID=A0A2T9YY40_9FUNG|nr:hypothetical protein BB561_000684 [Smittium simulii]